MFQYVSRRYQDPSSPVLQRDDSAVYRRRSLSCRGFVSSHHYPRLWRGWMRSSVLVGRWSLRISKLNILILTAPTLLYFYYFYYSVASLVGLVVRRDQFIVRMLLIREELMIVSVHDVWNHRRRDHVTQEHPAQEVLELCVWMRVLFELNFMWPLVIIIMYICWFSFHHSWLYQWKFPLQRHTSVYVLGWCRKSCLLSYVSFQWLILTIKCLCFCNNLLLLTNTD